MAKFGVFGNQHVSNPWAIGADRKFNGGYSLSCRGSVVLGTAQRPRPPRLRHGSGRKAAPLMARSSANVYNDSPNLSPLRRRRGV
jgi:hypothetical protein